VTIIVYIDVEPGVGVSEEKETERKKHTSCRLPMREERQKCLEGVGRAAGAGWAEVAEGLKPSVRDVGEVATWFRGVLWGERVGRLVYDCGEISEALRRRCGPRTAEERRGSMAAIETERTANGRKTAVGEREARGESGGRWAQRGAKRAGGGCWESRWWLLGKQSSSVLGLGLGHSHSYLGADSISARCRLKIIIYIYL